jgi:hypothetical protein
MEIESKFALIYEYCSKKAIILSDFTSFLMAVERGSGRLSAPSTKMFIGISSGAKKEIRSRITVLSGTSSLAWSKEASQAAATTGAYSASFGLQLKSSF